MYIIIIKILLSSSTSITSRNAAKREKKTQMRSQLKKQNKYYVKIIRPREKLEGRIQHSKFHISSTDVDQTFTYQWLTGADYNQVIEGFIFDNNFHVPYNQELPL